MAAIATETVTQVHHWNDSLFSFRTTRDPGFRFENGHFVMLGLPGEAWTRFGGWLVLGLVVYGVYGRRHSRLR